MRGYDQAVLIAQSVAERSSLPYATALARKSDGRQVGANKYDRSIQARSAFRPTKQYFIQNKDILIIDDVVTTGATMEAAAAVLKQAGARSVSGAAFARVL
jgi:predicted amidophosphoribosyltransferase